MRDQGRPADRLPTDRLPTDREVARTRREINRQSKDFDIELTTGEWETVGKAVKTVLNTVDLEDYEEETMRKFLGKVQENQPD